MPTLTQKSNGFKDLLKDVVLKIANDSNSELLNKLITFDNKLEKDLALRSLTFTQQVIFQEVCEGALPVQLAQDIPQNSDYVAVGYKSIGKPIIDINYQKAELDFIAGYSPLRLSSIERIQTKAAELKKREALYEMEISEFFNEASEQEIREMVDTVYFNIYHMAPGFIYIENDIFSNFYEFNNTIKALRGKSDIFILDELKTKALNEWTFVEKKYIYNLYWLIRSGGPTRVEEFNAFQLYCTTLHQYLNEKISEYLKELDEDAEAVPMSISEKALYTAKLRKKMQADFLFIREINGLTVHKKERFFSFSEVPVLTIHNFPTSLEEYISKKYNLTFSDNSGPYDLFYKIVKAGFENEIFVDNEGKFDFIEELINETISLAVEATEADMGMSRSFRNFKEFIEAIDHGDAARACNWKQPDYFCCVTPSDQFMNRLIHKGPLLANILLAISTRMQYNSWHYMPGHFPFEEVPDNRHFYFPPVMADTAVWSNQHHKGHLNAQVKYSIRSPQAIIYNKKTFNAFFDLRLMKQEGDPFSQHDLKTALYYTSVLQNLYQALMDYIAETRIDYCINSFTKSWFKKHYTI
ncbi:hypothetical protein [Bacillus glycinifermentans]|uniref:Uncharacterized protein n=1 Tax=Bacillus glycinifermentans TaxID=1664069 RepID=A0A0T6BUK6_9BACI|nr:hypothetical protein [Bacillus glycinifermentans]ATH92548.1 hypothetical protein COP00_07895 [Bacillus glycinifermentans]KRT95298.1 hypothetical protein AB447_212425 [Bacillus glycinifermentans]MEC0485102.1 hypothetical protein [Bacillus glycinifermentans]